MKKLALGLFVFFISLNLSAQTEKGNALVGGTVNIGLQLIENSDDLFFLNINPSYGQFVADNFAVGGNVGLSYSRINDNRSSSISLTPFIRYYFDSFASSRFFLDVQGGPLFLKRENGFGDGSSTEFLFRAGPGIALFVSDNISFDIALNYTYISGNDDFLFGGRSSTKQIGVFMGFQIFLVNDAE